MIFTGHNNYFFHTYIMLGLITEDHLWLTKLNRPISVKKRPKTELMMYFGYWSIAARNMSSKALKYALFT